MDKILNDLSGHKDINISDQNGCITVTVSTVLIAICRPEDSSILFKVPAGLPDPLGLLLPIREKGMTAMLRVESARDRGYAKFILSSIISGHREEKDRASFNLDKELRNVISAFAEDNHLSRDEWESLLLFAHSFNCENPEQELLLAFFAFVVSSASKRFAGFSVHRQATRLKLSAGAKNKDFCVMDCAESGSVYLYFEDPPPAAELVESKKKGWLVLKNVIYLENLETLLELIRISLGQVLHGRFWSG